MLWAPGAIPTVDFILPYCGRAVKKMGVKNKDWTRRRGVTVRQSLPDVRLTPAIGAKADDPGLFSSTDKISSLVIFTRQPFLRPNRFLSNIWPDCLIIPA
jgi:hypothetical protein